MKKRNTIGILVVIFVIYCVIPTAPSKIFLNKIDLELLRFKQDFFNAKYAILIDFERPVFRKRLWVVDIQTKKVLLNSHVSHALKSGIIWATNFSNEEGSNISSVGTFKTLNSYKSSFGRGKYKIGMRIQGLEKGKNDRVFVRHIVFHPSYWPWSSGCFMTPPQINKKIINLTKNGNIVIVNQ